MVRIRLRHLTLAMVAAAAATAGPAVGEPRNAAFDILRKGEPIGSHVVTVEDAGERTVVDTRIEMRVKFGPLPLYRYNHRAREVWFGGVLESIDSRTNDNGRKSSLAARRDGDLIEIDGTAFRGAAPLTVVPSSYWNRELLGAPVLLNTQNGELIDVETMSLGVTRTPDGAAAEQFRIVGTLALDLWYDGPLWVASTFTIDGEELTYRPATPGGYVEASLDD
ncbi:MAG: DUF6134 family protein [Parvularculaceae bacterium]